MGWGCPLLLRPYGSRIIVDARPFAIVRSPHQARLDRVQIYARQLKKKNRSDKTNRRSRDMPAHYTARARISKRKGRKAAESLKGETLRYPAL
jgi:hypothetical protein